MLRRTLILTLTLAAVFAVTGVGGASAKPSFQFGFVLPPMNPNPPKDKKIFRLPIAVDKLPSFLQHIRLYYAVWPSGAVTASLLLSGL